MRPVRRLDKRWLGRQRLGRQRLRRQRLWQPPLALSLLAALIVTLSAYVVIPAVAAPARHDQFTTFAEGMREGSANGRSYFLHVTGDTPRPLLVVLHGWRLTPEQAAEQTGFTAYADAHGFDVAYPQSDDSLSSWNAGGCCGSERYDDVTFLTHVVADIRLQTPITVAYAAGFSNGGMMALRMACQTTVFAAVASVAGPLLVPCHKKIVALHIQGDDDSTVPLHGGYSGLTQTVFPDSTREGLVRLEVFHGKHEWPAGATARIWSFLTGTPAAAGAGISR